jgi:hypothetical protein
MHLIIGGNIGIPDKDTQCGHTPPNSFHRDVG